MKNLKIFSKIFLSHTMVGFLAIAALSSVVYFVISSILIQRTLDQLSSINILKKDLVENYFTSSHQNLKELQLENKFVNLYNTIEADPKVTSSQSIHDLLEIDSISKLYNFKNLYVFNNSNKLLYSTAKSQFSSFVKSKLDSVIIKKMETQLVDVTPFSNNKQALLYYYVPIIKDNTLHGCVLVQENMQKIQNILLENTGMGSTGESYVIGSDFTLRSASRFFQNKPPASITVKTIASKNALKHISGQGVFKDYRNKNVLSVYRPINISGLTWAIVSEIDWQEAMEPVIEIRNYLLAITFIIILATLGITYFLSNAIARPVLELKEIIFSLARGTKPSTKFIVTTTVEINLMAKAVEQLIESMQRTTNFANEIGAGNFNTTFTKLSEEDKLGHALLHMRDELRSFHDREIKLARERAAALIEGQENERKRIINELHDGVGQLLTAVRMRIEMLENDTDLKEEIKTQINEIIAEVKRISYNVMPQALVDFGLEAALKGLCGNVKKYAAFSIDFRYVNECNHLLNFETTIAVFRIAQEGLNNIVKHANATHVNFHVLDKEDELYLVLEDDGKGFNEGKMRNASSGLRNIRERAQLLNGYAEINSTEGHGTVIEIHIPIHPNNINTGHDKNKNIAGG